MKYFDLKIAKNDMDRAAYRLFYFADTVRSSLAQKRIHLTNDVWALNMPQTLAVTVNGQCNHANAEIEETDDYDTTVLWVCRNCDDSWVEEREMPEPDEDPYYDNVERFIDTRIWDDSK